MMKHYEEANRTRLAAMSLAQKVGQVMMIGVDPTATGASCTSLTSEMAGLIAELHAGGLVLFERNVGQPDELARLTADAQSVAQRTGAPGLIVSIDQEGGRVARMRESRGYTEIPSAMALGATGDPEAASEAATLLARELTAAGINMDLAPDLDVNSNPRNPVIGTRSFGSDPQRVAQFGVAFVEGLQANGVMAVGKHFPGHGDTALDSHYALAVVPHEAERLERVELVPFRAAMAAGVAGIMSAHVTFPAVDPTPGLPGTLSPRVMAGLLRRQMGYDGLLLTDSLEMGALAASGHPLPQVAVEALAAGADMLCISHGFEIHRLVHAALVAAVEQGVVPQHQLDDAVLRILAAKARFGVLDGGAAPAVDVSAETGSAAGRAVARRLAAAAITVVRDERALLPLARTSEPLIVELAAASGPASGKVPPAVAARLAHILGGEPLVLPADPSESHVREVVVRSRGRLTVVATADVAQHPGQAVLVRALLAAGAKLVLVAVDVPYDLRAFPEIGTCIASYGANPPTLDALAAVLTGELPARGRLPVEL